MILVSFRHALLLTVGNAISEGVSKEPEVKVTLNTSDNNGFWNASYISSPHYFHLLKNVSISLWIPHQSNSLALISCLLPTFIPDPLTFVTERLNDLDRGMPFGEVNFIKVTTAKFSLLLLLRDTFLPSHPCNGQQVQHQTSAEVTLYFYCSRFWLPCSTSISLLH